jgi:hypothetical protein
MAAKAERRLRHTNWLGLFSFGFFVMLLGAIWVMSPPALTEEARSFFKSESWQLTPLTGNISILEPKNTAMFSTIYTAAEQFCFIFGFFQITILTLRFVLHDSLARKADTVSGITFWLSAGYFLSWLLANLASQPLIPHPWFAFLAGIVVSGGIAIIASSIVKLFR